MGWKHPQISLHEMVNLVKGLVEILILGSGYQSTGVFVSWDVPNLRKALQWAEFFESFFLEFSYSEYYEESMKEFDSVLSELTSKPSFPQGLAHLTSATLTRARKLVVEQLIRGLPLRSEHLRSVVVATLETDLRGLSNEEDHCISRYLNKFTLEGTSLDSALHENCSSEFSQDSCSERVANVNAKPVVGGSTGFCIQALLKRQCSALCASDLASGLIVISGTVTRSNLIECDETFLLEKSWAATTLMNEGNEKEQEQARLMSFHRWKARTLSFFLDKRTVRLVSGARILFTTPQARWIRLLDQLNIPEGPNDNSSGAKVELLLLGCIARRWGHIIKHFTSISINYGNASEMFSELCNLLPGRRERFGDVAPSVENTLIEYLMKLLDGCLSSLWKLDPILPAVAIPYGSQLFKVYLSQIESILRDDSPASRCCTSSREKEHIDCELGQRIWCLHASHVRGSCIWRHSSDD